jgi:putative IMPACT (imprinted ancient) family translation regulator
MIDSVKDNLDSIITNIEDLDEVKYLIKAIKNEMEDIRDHVSEIRSWGSDWQEFSESLEKEKDNEIFKVRFRHDRKST